LYKGGAGAGGVLLLAAVLFWGVRLTANWAYTFKNFTVQDWRYDMLKGKSGRFYFFVSLFGIHLFPTVVVFLCLIPAFYYIENGAPVNPAALCGFALCVLGTSLSLVSDCELHGFRRVSGKNEIIRSGLWKYSRHPNYLGEITMWWGVFVFSLAVSPFRWYLPAGAAANTLMFVFISIPMAEKHMETYKKDFGEYKKETGMLLPIKRHI
jgi:steroid 5-alpha reductase family enzyme